MWRRTRSRQPGGMLHAAGLRRHREHRIRNSVSPCTVYLRDRGGSPLDPARCGRGSCVSMRFAVRGSYNCTYAHTRLTPHAPRQHETRHETSRLTTETRVERPRRRRDEPTSARVHAAQHVLTVWHKKHVPHVEQIIANHNLTWKMRPLDAWRCSEHRARPLTTVACSAAHLCPPIIHVYRGATRMLRCTPLTPIRNAN